MKPIKYPTKCPETNDKIMFNIYEREMREAIPPKDAALLILLGGAVMALISAGILSLIL